MAIKINGVTVISNSQAITTTSTISATGNITGGNVSVVGTITAAGINTGASPISTTGNVGGGNVITGGIVSATGNIYGGNLSVSGNITGNFNLDQGVIATGNVTGGNILTAGLVSAIGTITTGANISAPSGYISVANGLYSTNAYSGTFTDGIVVDYLTGNGRIHMGSADGLNIYNGATIANTLIASLNSTGSLTLGTTGTGNLNGGNVNAGGNVSATGSLRGANVTTVGFISATSTITTAGQLGANTVSATGDVSVGGNLSVTGNVNFSGNINQISGNSGQFFGNSTTGYGALYAGIPSGYTSLLSTVLQLASNANTYSQLNQQNINSGSLASSDYIATSDNGSDTSYYGDFGINSSTFSDSGNTVFGPSDTYLYGVGTSANGPYSGTGANLLLGATNGQIKLFVGGLQSANVIASVSNIGINVTGRVSATGTVTAASTVGGVITGSSTSVTGNVTAGNLVTSGAIAITGASTAGSYSTVGNVTGGNILTSGLISVTGNITGGNISATNYTGTNVSVTGTVTAASTVGGVITGSSTSVTGTVTGGNITGGTASVTGNITGGNLITAGTLTVNSGGAAAAIINGAANTSGNIGSSTGWFNTVYATSSKALYADLAENYQADAEYAPGTVLVFGGTAEVTVNAVDGDRKVAGVVSTNPSYVMNAGLDGANVAAVALTGRVPCFVLGPVQKGDLMVAAGLGRARAEADPKVGSVIGKALEDFDGAEGTIEVVVGRF